MATGETSFSSKGVQAKKSFPPPLPPGEYELRLLGSTAEVGKKDEPGKMPYVRVSFEIVGHNFASGKARTQMVWFLTDMTPSSKDGIRNPERQGQIVDYAHAAGVDFDIGFQEVSNGNGGTVTCLNAQQLKDYLLGLDGTVVKARLKVEKQSGRDPANKIDHFVQSENAASFG